MKEDKDFRSMMDSIESQKERGYPSGSSHFAKMQCIGGAKPGWIGRDKDWPMPDKIPDAKENHQHLEKTDDSIKETSDAKAADETKSQKKIKPVNTEAKEAFDNMMGHPMDQLNSIIEQTFPNRNKTTHKEASATKELPSFKDMMAFKKMLTIGDIMYYPGYDPDYIPTLPSVPIDTKQTTLDDGPNSFFSQDNYIENELARRTNLDNDVTNDDVAQERALENVARDHVERKALKDDKIEGKVESSAPQKNSKGKKKIGTPTERKP